MIDTPRQGNASVAAQCRCRCSAHPMSRSHRQSSGKTAAGEFKSHDNSARVVLRGRPERKRSGCGSFSGGSNESNFDRCAEVQVPDERLDVVHHLQAPRSAPRQESPHHDVSITPRAADRRAVVVDHDVLAGMDADQVRGMRSISFAREDPHPSYFPWPECRRVRRVAVLPWVLPSAPVDGIRGGRIDGRHLSERERSIGSGTAPCAAMRRRAPRRLRQRSHARRHRQLGRRPHLGLAILTHGIQSYTDATVRGAVFDVVSGGTADHPAGPGWDDPTGWGAPNAAAFAATIPGPR
jgi:hypothetical protein